MIVPLEGFHQFALAQRLGVHALSAQEHHREIGGGRRAHELAAHPLGGHEHLLIELPGEHFHRFRIPRLLGVQQAVVSFLGTLGVDGQIGNRLAFPSGQLDGEIHPLPVPAEGHVLLVLAHVHQLGQQAAQLDFPQQATGLDAGEHLFQVPHAGGQALHLSQFLIHLFQPLAYRLEAFAQALVQRLAQPLVHGTLHLVQPQVVALLQPLDLPGVALPQVLHLLLHRLAHPLQPLLVLFQLGVQHVAHPVHAALVGGQALFYGAAHIVHACLVHPGHIPQLAGEGVQLGLLGAGHFPHHPGHRVAHAPQIAAEGFPVPSGGLSQLGLGLAQLFAQGLFHAA